MTYHNSLKNPTRLLRDRVLSPESQLRIEARSSSSSEIWCACNACCGVSGIVNTVTAVNRTNAIDVRNAKSWSEDLPSGLIYLSASEGDKISGCLGHRKGQTAFALRTQLDECQRKSRNVSETCHATGPRIRDILLARRRDVNDQGPGSCLKNVVAEVQYE